MSEEEAALLKEAQEEADIQRNEAMFAQREVEALKEELRLVKIDKQKLEQEGSPEDVVALEGQIEELRGLNEDLDMENKTLKEEIDQKDDELVPLPTPLPFDNFLNF